MQKKVFLFIGGLFVTGAVAYTIYKCKRTLQLEDPVNEALNDNTCKNTNSTCPKMTTMAAVEIPNVKDSTVHSVKERHHEAEKVMEEALCTIFKENDSNDITTDNSEVFDEIKNELDELLK